MKHRRGGFTFLELLIALSLFSAGMVSMLQIFPVNRRYLTQSADTTQASFLAQEQIEYVRTLDYDSLTVGAFEASHTLGDNSSDPLNQYSRSTTVSYVNGSWAASATDAGLKKIEVNVTWSERSGNRQYSLVTYVYDK